MKLTDAADNEISFNIYPDFIHSRTMSLDWGIASNGEYFSIDRGVSADVYKSSFNVKYTESYIDAIINFISTARKNALLSGNENYQFTIESENDGEYIFGPDVDISGGSTVTITDYGERKQLNWKLWGLTISAQIASPVFVGTSTFPDNFNAKTKIETYSTWNIKNLEFYNGDFEFIDQNSDTGMMKFSFELTDEDMRDLCRYVYSTVRGGTISSSEWPVFYKSDATENPFDVYGPRRTHTTNGFKIKALDNLRYTRPGWWGADLTFVESFL